jgi:hypothetical protein
MNLEQLHGLHARKLAESFGVSTAQAAFRDDRAARALGDDDESLRNINVGFFSGRRPSYQRYSASPAASDVVKKVL